MPVGCSYVNVTSTNPAIPAGWYVEDENRGYYRLTLFGADCSKTLLNHYLSLKGSGARDFDWVFSERTPGVLQQAGQITYPFVKKYYNITGVYSDDPAHAMAGNVNYDSFSTFTDLYKIRIAASGLSYTHVVESNGSFGQISNLPKTIQTENGVTRYLHGLQMREEQITSISRFDDYAAHVYENVAIGTQGTTQNPANIDFFGDATLLPTTLTYSGALPTSISPAISGNLTMHTWAHPQFPGFYTLSGEFTNFGSPGNRPFYHISYFYPSAEHVIELQPTDQTLGNGVTVPVTLNAPLQTYYQSVWASITDLASFPSADGNLCPSGDYQNSITDVSITLSPNNAPPCNDVLKPGAPLDLQSSVAAAPGPPLNLQSNVSATGERADYVGTTKASKYKGWVFDERTSAISGPFDHESITAISTKDNSAEMYCVTEDKEVKKTNLLEFNNPNFPTFPDPFTDILTPFDGSVAKGIVLSEIAKGYCYRNRFIAEPFTDSVMGGGTVQDPLFFRNSYLANSETNWLHLGDEHSEKQVYRVDLRFHKNSCGHIWLYVMNDEGLVKGQYKGAIKEHMKVFTNLRGRSFKIQMMIATHYDYPWAMREMAIGHLYGKSF